MTHERLPGPKFPFRASQWRSSGRWGVWDNRLGVWAVAAEHDQQFAEFLAVAMVDAYAAGAADTIITEARR